uniref:J domain-containing protein n=1 Tax=Globodera rostochiensis TaxID=31243 RepID=A0A914I6N5_GLORO
MVNFNYEWLNPPLGVLGLPLPILQISYLSFITFALIQLASSQRKEIDKHLEQGKYWLSKGQFQEALQHYHQAVALDPSDYQIYYRRATVFLASGKVNAALPDLEKVVELKPDFIAGRIQRGNILFKKGNLKEAEADFEFAVKHEPGNAESRERMQKISQIQAWIDNGLQHFENKDFAMAEQMLNYAIEHCQWNADLHRKRSRCRLARGDTQNAIADIRAVAKLVPDSTETFLELSRIYYEIGDVENAMGQIRECLHLSPEHKECFPFYKRIKKLTKMRQDLMKSVLGEQWMDCLEKAKSILRFEREVDPIQMDVYKYTCKCNVKLSHVAEAIQECTEVLKYGDENDLDVLLDRGEAFLLNEQYEKAVEDFQKAVNAHEGSRRAKEQLTRAQKMLKLSKKKDYYKILGVRRNADKRQVMKAYRKLAQQWHPDNFQDDAEKERAQEKFFDIANAKDVLTDPEKRRRYDAGEDPLDPQGGHGGGQQFHQWHWSGEQGGFNPFGEGFNPFGDNDGKFTE